MHALVFRGDYHISERVRQLGEAEAALILRPEAEFRFHSGVPVAA